MFSASTCSWSNGTSSVDGTVNDTPPSSCRTMNAWCGWAKEEAADFFDGELDSTRSRGGGASDD
jgi:hypothetical protein